MSWYGAHIITYLEFLEKEQSGYELYDNLVLVKADTLIEAFAEARRLGTKYEVAVEVEGRPARWVLGGIRCLVECQDVDTETLTQKNDYVPSHGTEVSYTALAVSSRADLTKFLNGEAVVVSLDEVAPITSLNGDESD